MDEQKKSFCPNCGGQNEYTSNFCIYCGGSLHNTQNTTPSQNHINQETQVNPNCSGSKEIQKEKKETKLGFLGWVGLIYLGYITLASANLVLYAVAGVVLYFYLLVPNTKKGFNVVFKVIGAIVLFGILSFLVLLGVCLGMFAGLS